MALGARLAEGGGDHHGAPVSKDVRHMLRDISATNIEHSIAAALELARVMSKHSFDATIKFVTFSGEEQGALRLDVLREPGRGREHEHRGHVLERHCREQPRDERRPRPS